VRRGRLTKATKVRASGVAAACRQDGGTTVMCAAVQFIALRMNMFSVNYEDPGGTVGLNDGLTG
jgi:hypothetical protein